MRKFYFTLIFAAQICSGCQMFTGEVSGSISPNAYSRLPREWTILTYMAGDNELEQYAMADLCEMEKASFNTNEITMLALIDRHDGYDTSNGNWTGSRLYKINSGRKPETNKIISEQIECDVLGLSKEYETELEMSSGGVLSDAIAFAKEKYPARHYGLIIWGHGNGWRGFAFDDVDKTYMSLYQLGKAIEEGCGGQKLDFLGFDTCFGANVEVCYQLRNCSKYFVGSEGVVSATGWNYTSLLSDFYRKKFFSAEDFCKTVVEQFENQYLNRSKSTIVAVDMEKVSAMVGEFNRFCEKSSQLISSVRLRDGVVGALMKNSDSKVAKYSYGKKESDIYLDVQSVGEALFLYFQNCCNAAEGISAEGFSELSSAYGSLNQKIEDMTLFGWSNERKNGGLGVYFSSYCDSAGTVFANSLPAEYVCGRTINQIDFVRDCTGYVPGNVTGNSLLDKIFYEEF